MKNKKSHTLRDGGSICSIVMVINIVALLMTAPQDAVHIGIIAVSALILFFSIFRYRRRAKTVLISSILIMIIGVIGTVQHRQTGITMLQPLIYLCSGVIILLWIRIANHVHAIRGGNAEAQHGK